MAAANVQSTRGTSASSSTPSRAYTSNVTAGNLLCWWIQWDSNTVTLNSVADSLGQTHILKENPTANATLSKRAAMGYFENTAGGACTITWTFSGSVTSTQEIHEASGLATSSAFDTSRAQGQDAVGSGTDLITSLTRTPSVSGCYIFGCAGEFSSGSAINAGTGFTSTGTTGNAPGGNQRGEYLIQGAAASVAATFTASGTGNYTIAGMMVFKPVAAGGSGKPDAYYRMLRM